jgi:hypothetical protein
MENGVAFFRTDDTSRIMASSRLRKIYLNSRLLITKIAMSTIGVK